jgi:hypothetical protein
MLKVFIQANNRQLFGARLAKFALEKHASRPINIEILNVDELLVFRAFVGKSFRRGHEIRTYTLDDLQSFTLSRFMPPELMGYDGRAVVLDPDIFALADIWKLLGKDMQEYVVLACPKKNAWDSSVMLLDCAKLTHWDIGDILERLASHKLNYTTLMTLAKEDVGELTRDWNSLDILSEETKMLHTTERLTQPWKTGLPIDFTRNRMSKLFGIIPREPIHKLIGKYPTYYLPHPDKTIEEFFIALAREAYQAGVFSKEEIEKEICAKHVRRDMLNLIGV